VVHCKAGLEATEASPERRATGLYMAG